MKVLCIVNNVMPKLAEKTGLTGSSSGSWLIDISEKISKEKDVSLAIATVGGNKFKKIEIDNITYYLLPGNGKNLLFYTKKYEKIWKNINEDFKPDVVHLYGTEYAHGLSFLRANLEVKAVVSVQGIISKIKDVLFDGLPKRFDLKYSTIKERIKLNGLYPRYLLYKKNSKLEKEILSRVNYASVVNKWDYSAVKAINPALKFFPIEYNLRESFYASKKWNIESANNYQIFTAPGSDSVKGLHILLKAIHLVKRNYKEIKVVVPGFQTVNGKMLVNTGYKKYIYKLIKELDLEDNIVFKNRLTEQEMARNMLSSRIVVVPSQIEGTSLVLRESMYLGLPCIASFRGGMADFVEDRINGLLYDFNEYEYLAQLIEELFSNDELAKSISKNAIDKAEKAHERNKNVKATLDMYREIYGGNKDE